MGIQRCFTFIEVRSLDQFINQHNCFLLRFIAYILRCQVFVDRLTLTGAVFKTDIRFRNLNIHFVTAVIICREMLASELLHAFFNHLYPLAVSQIF